MRKSPFWLLSSSGVTASPDEINRITPPPCGGLFIMCPDAQNLDVPILFVHLVDKAVLNIEPAGIYLFQSLELFHGRRILERILPDDIEEPFHLLPQMGSLATLEMFQGLTGKAYFVAQRETSDSGTHSSQGASIPSSISRAVPEWEKRYTVSMRAL